MQQKNVTNTFKLLYDRFTDKNSKHAKRKKICDCIHAL